ncbi:class I lanthipeptide [Pedobacter sp. BG31]|uniref:class I lanthipeptide n=1 Tax=Pedobacter sp. BG31 TaxID=3349697 RepID=UPI0035F34075
MKKIFNQKLKLNKEVIIKLNSESLSTIMGGQNNIISYFSCLGGCNGSEVYNVEEEAAFKSCCKGSCNG